MVAASYGGVQCRALVERTPGLVGGSGHLAEDEVAAGLPFVDACETVLLVVENGRFSFRNDLFLDDQLRVVYPETLPLAGMLSSREYAPRRCTKVSGTVAYLSNTWIENYYHWMQLTLPLLRLYRVLAPDIPIDYYYVGERSLAPFHYESLRRAGISPDRLIRTPCTADVMLVASYVHRPQNGGLAYRDSRGQEFVRDLFAAEVQRGMEQDPTRLYVGRAGDRKRRVANEPNLVTQLSAYGFSSLSLAGRTVAEQAGLFASAEMIVGVHGAALTNTIFARPGAAIVEILPPGFAEASFMAAAAHAHLDHYYVVGDAPITADGPFTPRHQDLRLDPEKLQRVLALASIDHPDEARPGVSPS